ncbi:D-alpha,beta-D-heptose 7-phosphate 1-kinase /D-beta-D-heptose 1-phosphate adenylyltransferase [Sphingomonas gellani]|uniref:Bifunctional protein HldE n=1 Tax=Sphingomonas gellani TaxID=1166340 RepID=A0A1H8I6M0_9SPHN|nr:D-glycero-beta-D-manno-heptose-7-phosphate kinase [Sphingomonas gellani]SEN63984.1 D-alpha,beta-D-heptose 7-phosphate 1-kinase /D-beta-D-heptose 1-phosphate adenylyltransferase [Sphingomonas gellani]
MEHYLDRLTHRRVALIGDLMLDCYISGDVRRISPEAPVPVLQVSGQRSVAGGTANVATNLAALGLQVNVVGVVGDDDARQELVTLLATGGDIDCSSIVTIPGRRTIKKLRIIGAHQQIVRVDQEDTDLLAAEHEAAIIAAARTAIDACDVVVISDYGKGVCSDAVLSAVLAHARLRWKTVLIDPKRTDFSAYRGASIITPNRKELFEATRLPCETDAEARIAAERAQEACGAAILLTRSEKGMSLFPLDGAPLHLPTVAQDVFDVSGAGDTVIAVVAAAVAADIPLADAIRMANHAAGIVVSKLGTACVTRDELAASLAAENASPSVNDGRLLDWNDLVAQRWAWAREKLVVGFANGCFDLLHPGHVSLLRQAAACCDRLVVALNSDASVRRLKGPSRPVQDEGARALVMGAIRGVSAVTLFDQDTPLELITALKPDVIVKGADYTEDQVVGGDVVRARGGRVMLARLEAGHSTSRLVAVANRS